VKTLHIRMREHMKNGLEVARYLEKHPLVEKVVHPGIYNLHIKIMYIEASIL
jgi:cystathionine gamma-lyase